MELIQWVPCKRKSKLQLRAQGPFWVCERVGENAHKIDLPEEYVVSSTFNVSDLSPHHEDHPKEEDQFSQPSIYKVTNYNDPNKKGGSLAYFGLW